MISFVSRRVYGVRNKIKHHTTQHLALITLTFFQYLEPLGLVFVKAFIIEHAAEDSTHPVDKISLLAASFPKLRARKWLGKDL